MKEPQPPRKAAQLELTIKPLPGHGAERKSSNETVPKARVVVATFF